MPIYFIFRNESDSSFFIFFVGAFFSVSSQIQGHL